MFNRNSKIFNTWRVSHDLKVRTIWLSFHRQTFCEKKKIGVPILNRQEGTTCLVALARCFTKRNKPPIIHLISHYCSTGGNIFLTHLLSSFRPEAWRLIAAVILRWLVYCNCRCYSSLCVCLIIFRIIFSHSHPVA